MIPSGEILLDDDFTIVDQPSKTYKIDFDKKIINGYIDGIEAVKQSIFKILNTERYKYVIYSWNYGIEIDDLFGEPVDYVCPELTRRITDALLQDTRILSVGDFNFETKKRGKISVNFTVKTIYGDAEGVEMVVNI